jgi:alpha-beta hydrolase superfamily lysophospholipase
MALIYEKEGIIYRYWKHPLPEAILLLVHGLGGHSERWEFLADFFLKNNISSYAIELKGFGETAYLKGHIESFDIYYNDLHKLCQIIKEENPGKKIYLAGESIGALICFLFAILEPENFSGLILISPLFKNKLKFNLLDYLKIFFFLLCNPKKQFEISFDAEMFTRDKDYINKINQDNREHRLATAKLFFEILLAWANLGFLKNRLKVPTLFLIAGQDKLVDTRMTKKLFESLKLENKKILEYPQMLHALSIDIGRNRVFEDILEWMQ